MKNNLWAQQVYEYEINYLRDFLDKNHKDYYIIGVSGGIDSALTLKMLVNAVGPQKVKAYYLPIEFQNKFEEISKLEECCGVHIDTVDLTQLWTMITDELEIQNANNISNQKPKIRSLFLSAQAFECNGVVVGNVNYDEYYLGYFTKTGDGSADIFPLINLLKSDIYDLSSSLGIHKDIINQTPSADLIIGQSDEKEIGVHYPVIDSYLRHESVNLNAEVIIQQWHNKNRHKHVLNHWLLENFPYKRD
ncbi:NAD(+) synthase [Ureaplasma ceti]|uniref:NH(3)-dependent NAD(+) synthetase n=1 Tax=Ureaplasma ceti TaxID=3119530 RepID=A0ABP9U9L6_9BACT